MEDQVVYIEFEKLRLAYKAVKGFLEKESCRKVDNLSIRVAGDLGIVGDDNLELLERFVEKFELNYQGFNYPKHFHSEAELFGSEAAFGIFLRLSVWLPLKAIELLTLNKIKFQKPSMYTPEREVSDMTFRCLVTWYVENQYPGDSGVVYRIKEKE